MKEVRKRTGRDLIRQPYPYALSAKAALLCFTIFAALVYIYSPALGGSFVFDDLSLPFSQPARYAPLSAWMAGVRPVLMLSYWVNFRLWGTSPFSYHFVNLMIHAVNTGLVFLVLLRIVKMAGWPEQRARAASLIGTVVFAIHPLQTESVSYVAGRSESLAALFLLLAYVVFLYRRRESISWMEALLVLVLFAIGVKTKENAVSLAGILVLTDLFWPVPFSIRGLRCNWRLYALMVPGVAVALIAVFRLLATASSAGFAVATFKWYQYAFTEARAIFTYVRLAAFPLGQSLDHDFATSHTILERGAIFYIVLLGALLAVSVMLRRRYPLLCFGLLMFLIWLAPTSSIVPLDDALVERRMYLALIGLILMACEAGLRLRLSPHAGAASLCLLVLLFGNLCYDRNRLWGDPDKLLELAAANAIHNPRPLLNYTETLIQRNQCALATPYLERAERRLPNNYYVNAAWGRTLACLGQFDRAIERFQAAARLMPSSKVYEWMGLVYAEMGLRQEAGGTLKKAVALAPNSETAHGSLALWYEKNNDLDNAEKEYRAALSLDRGDWWALQGWMRVQAVRTARSPGS